MLFNDGRNLVGHCLKQKHVIMPECVPPVALDVENADYPIGKAQWQREFGGGIWQEGIAHEMAVLGNVLAHPHLASFGNTADDPAPQSVTVTVSEEGLGVRSRCMDERHATLLRFRQQELDVVEAKRGVDEMRNLSKQGLRFADGGDQLPKTMDER
nr:hypothetical protein [Sinorhizobium medicae]